MSPHSTRNPVLADLLENFIMVARYETKISNRAILRHIRMRSSDVTSLRLRFERMGWIAGDGAVTPTGSAAIGRRMRETGRGTDAVKIGRPAPKPTNFAAWKSAVEKNPFALQAASAKRRGAIDVIRDALDLDGEASITRALKAAGLDRNRASDVRAFFSDAPGFVVEKRGNTWWVRRVAAAAAE